MNEKKRTSKHLFNYSLVSNHANKRLTYTIKQSCSKNERTLNGIIHENKGKRNLAIIRVIDLNLNLVPNYVIRYMVSSPMSMGSAFKIESVVKKSLKLRNNYGKSIN